VKNRRPRKGNTATPASTPIRPPSPSPRATRASTKRKNSGKPVDDNPDRAKRNLSGIFEEEVPPPAKKSKPTNKTLQQLANGNLY